jgi:putative transposase
MLMSTQTSTGRIRSTYECIEARRDRYSVQMMCRVLGVAPSGYYKWLRQPISNRAQEDDRLLRLIRTSFVASHGIYGAPLGNHRVARLMREANLRALHGYRTRRWAVGKPVTVHRDTTEQGLGDRHHLHSDLAGLTLPRRRH